MARGRSGARGLRRRLGERVRFLRSFLRSPREVGSILPTSQRAVRDMLDLAPVDRARLVVELGAGTGPHTREILRRMGPQGELLALELDAALADRLAAELTDPRLRVIADDAANLPAHLAGRRPDVIVSALPFTSLPASARHELLRVSREVLADDGVMLVLQYSPFVQRLLERTFAHVERRISPLNVPPAVLFACRPGTPG
jgi:phospholipid N-methyltransferase